MQEAARRPDPEVEAAIAEVERLLREVRPRTAPADAAAPSGGSDAAPLVRPRRWWLSRLLGWLQPSQCVVQVVTAELRAAPCPSCAGEHLLCRRFELRWSTQEMASGQAFRRVEVTCPSTGQRFTLPVRFVQS